MFQIKHRLPAGVAVIALFYSLSASSQAQESALETITVTAQKKVENLSDVPVAITAFSDAMLNELQITEPLGLSGQTPGLATALNSVGAPSFSIRGVGLEDFIGNNTSGTAIYVDEVYPVSAAMQGFRLFDLERVEVLKGPQGTLYGRNSTGGAINFITAKPTEKPERYLTLKYDSLDGMDLSGAVSGPLSDQVLARAAVSYQKGFDGWQSGVNGSEDAGEADRISGRVHIKFEPTQELAVLLTVHGEQDKGVNPSWQADDRVGFDGFLGIQLSSSGRADQTDIGSFFAGVDGVRAPVNDTTQWGSNLHISAQTAIGDITSITGWQTLDRDAYDNNDGSPATLADFHFRTKVDQFSQEFRLNRDLGNRGSLILGVVYGRDTIDVIDDILATDTLNLFAPPGFRPSDFGIEVTVTADTRQVTDSLGIYAHTEWNWSDSLTLTLAGRFTDDEREFRGDVTDNTGFVIGGSGGIIVQANDSESETDFSWRIGLDHQATDNSLIYGSIATGFKSGVFYSGAVPDPLGWGYVPPEELTSFEIGFKTRVGELTQINAAVFHYQYDDKQSAIFIPTAFGPVSTLGTIPESQATGAELEVAAQLGDSIDLNFGVAYLDAEITSPPNDVRGVPIALPLLEGDELTQSPKLSFNIRAKYHRQLTNNLNGTAQFSYSYIDDMVQFLADPLSRSDDIHDLGLRFSVENEDKGWVLAVFAQNILDNEDKIFAYGNLFGNQTFALQRPRMIGVEFRIAR